ncbi:beta-galactosidase [Lactiplantibacillus fabifermentans T30PCM01]|uniref:Beta-galactosidase n=1 Tax=Lactiplantibacillus fabifermentans T30PCM01 TaxID=1400520 RepID=W6TBN3_9LACO|nr:beta-galactosidase [Lactiplantibacillus fabifermentans]ETY72940.1 beta-galactosidase [Lactiplantibacillus fabifermentans T30PCM01]
MKQTLWEAYPILFGGDYNPEQWPEATWETDMEMLAQAHVNSATINVFSWALLEPQEGTYDFSMLDKIINLLQKHNFQIVMATSTAALPAWMVKQYPDVTRVDTHGIRQGFGKRHNACPNSPNFQRLAQDLVTAIAKRYAHNSNIVCWHISNEYGGQCYCDNCAQAFRNWLQKRYGTIAALNQAWDTNIWSHTFHSFDEIVPPDQHTDEFENGGAMLGGESLDYRRFQSDSLLANFKLEKDIIRATDQKTPITTNFMGTQKDLDYFKWAKELDVVSWDNYPSFDTPASFTAMNHDLMYGLKQAPFMLMEQTPSQQNWQPYNALKDPGEFRMLSYQAMAHGANTVQVFQLKQSRNGCESLHGSIISHVNSTETRVFKESAQIGQELAGLPADLLTSKKQADVAIIFDWASFWAIDFALGPSVRLDYVQQVHAYYQYFYSKNIAVDMISVDDDFSQYRLVIAPTLFVLRNETATKINEYVHTGGNFVTNAMSGLVDEEDNVHLNGYFKLLQPALGLWAEEWDVLPPVSTCEVNFNGHLTTKANIVCDLLHLDTATPLATYQTDRFYNGTPAVTANRYGTGQGFLVGTYLDEGGMQHLGDLLVTAAGLTSADQPTGVELSHRYSDKYQYDFLINTTAQARTYRYEAGAKATDLLTNHPVKSGELTLAPYAVKIIQQPMI